MTELRPKSQDLRERDRSFLQVVRRAGTSSPKLRSSRRSQHRYHELQPLRCAAATDNVSDEVADDAQVRVRQVEPKLDAPDGAPRRAGEQEPPCCSCVRSHYLIGLAGGVTAPWQVPGIDRDVWKQAREVPPSPRESGDSYKGAQVEQLQDAEQNIITEFTESRRHTKQFGFVFCSLPKYSTDLHLELHRDLAFSGTIEFKPPARQGVQRIGPTGGLPENPGLFPGITSPAILGRRIQLLRWRRGRGRGQRLDASPGSNAAAGREVSNAAAGEGEGSGWNGARTPARLGRWAEQRAAGRAGAESPAAARLRGGLGDLPGPPEKSPTGAWDSSLIRAQASRGAEAWGFVADSSSGGRAAWLEASRSWTAVAGLRVSVLHPPWLHAPAASACCLCHRVTGPAAPRTWPSSSRRAELHGPAAKSWLPARGAGARPPDFRTGAAGAGRRKGEQAPVWGAGAGPPPRASNGGRSLTSSVGRSRPPRRADRTSASRLQHAVRRVCCLKLARQPSPPRARPFASRYCHLDVLGRVRVAAPPRSPEAFLGPCC
nr:uncharacterized protein LOC117849073 [Setaria viridis]